MLATSAATRGPRPQSVPTLGRGATPTGSSPAASSSPISGWIPRSSSPGRRPHAVGESPSADRRQLAGHSPRRRGQRCCSRARCTPSTSAPRPGAGTARRSSPPPASSRSCPGACSPEVRTTLTSSHADPRKAPPPRPRDRRRSAQTHAPRRRDLVHQRAHAYSRAGTRAPGRGVLQTDGLRPASPAHRRRKRARA